MPSESSPLLHTSASATHPEPQSSRSTQRKHLQARTTILILLYLVFLDLGYELITPAQTRIFESIYCRLYYTEHDPSLIGSDGQDGVDEEWCKVSEVQRRVAMLKGWQIAFESIGSKFVNDPPTLPALRKRLTKRLCGSLHLFLVLIFSIPWASVADYRGRKPVILLLTLALFTKYAYIQVICYLNGTIPLEFTWLSALHTVAGGSVTVASALIYSIISDVVPEGERFVTRSARGRLLTGNPRM